jgi:rhodanese-related sulfurtransferase
MPDVSVEDLAAAHSRGAAQLIDVREPAEYVTGHVPGATSVPMAQLPGRLGELDRSKPVFVICQSGGRSAAMTHVLVHRGFDAHSVIGGTIAWARAGRPIDTGAPEGK